MAESPRPSPGWTDAFAPIERPAALVCHDAGAANVLLALWDGDPGDAPVMQGPARSLFAARHPEDRIVSLGEALERCRAVVTGTGWSSDLEHRARLEAQRAGLPSVALIDHWANYRERFERGGHVVLPDRLWVTDERAAEQARSLFPGTPVDTVGNPYLAECATGVRSAPDGDVLYLLEPVRQGWGRRAPGEFQALAWFLENRPRFGVPPAAAVRLRPHPSDPVGKYDRFLGRGVVLDTVSDLRESLSAARIVVGLETFALVIAIAAGKPTWCALPPWAPACRLPHPELRHLRMEVAP